MIKYGITAIAGLMMALAVYFLLKTNPERIAAQPLRQPPTSELASRVAAVGLIESSSENIAISPPVSGMVTAVFVKAGTLVRKGDKLFSLDDRDLQAEFRLRESNMAVAKTRLERLTNSPRPEEVPPAEARVQQAGVALADARMQLELIERVKDSRAIREEDHKRRRFAVQAAEAKLEEAKSQLALLTSGAWTRDIETARAEVALAESQRQRIAADIDRLTVRAPIDGKVLQLNLRTGEYAQAGVLPKPLLLLGNTDILHVRAEVDEYDAARVRAEATAMASPRGATDRKYALRFVRFEPFVTPKKTLTNDATERVDTRVLQVIYQIEKPESTFYIGQQVDIFIDAQPGPSLAIKENAAKAK